MHTREESQIIRKINRIRYILDTLEDMATDPYVSQKTILSRLKLLEKSARYLGSFFLSHKQFRK